MPTKSTSQNDLATKSISDHEIFQVHQDGNETSKSSSASGRSTQTYSKTDELNPHIGGDGDGDDTGPARICGQIVDDTLVSGDHQGLISSELEDYGDSLVAQIINDLLEQFYFNNISNKKMKTLANH